jgi:hypothetical protein
MVSEVTEFLDFQKLEMEHGTRRGHTAYKCKIKSMFGGTVLELDVLIELPHSDKKLSEIHREIIDAIHKATNPQRLDP